MTATNSQTSTIARYAAGPTELERALAGLQDADLDAPPAQGGWTIRQTVHHVVDGDDLWKLGIKAALGRVPRKGLRHRRAEERMMFGHGERLARRSCADR